ncbi:MAG: methionyl-tRNA formyltransferase, partial [Lachnospiraceae bacterium]|nr:methionyl-tRNA formyltransferase [Lachnospiraceae bacterium]
EVAKDYIRVKCKKGNVMIYELQAEGKKRLTVSEFIKGNRLQVGDILGNK